MPFATGTATDIDDLINRALKEFARDQAGWVVQDDNWPDILVLSKGTCFVNLRRVGENNGPTGSLVLTDAIVTAGISTNSLYALLSTGYSFNSPDADIRLVNQPGILLDAITDLASNAVEVNDLLGPFPSYHFYGSGPGEVPALYAVIETRAGFYNHLQFGIVDKLTAGYTTDAAFLAGSRYQINVTNVFARTEGIWSDPGHRQPFDDLSHDGNASNVQLYVGSAELLGDRIRRKYLPMYRRWSDIVFGGTDGVFNGATNSGKWATTLPALGANPTNGLTPLLPVLAAPELSAVSDAFFPLGTLPNLRLCSMKGRSAGEEVTFGDDTWALWPMRRQRGDEGAVPVDEQTPVFPYEATSGQLGWAYKKVV